MKPGSFNTTFPLGPDGSRRYFGLAVITAKGKTQWSISLCVFFRLFSMPITAPKPCSTGTNDRALLGRQHFCACSANFRNSTRNTSGGHRLRSSMVSGESPRRASFLHETPDPNSFGCTRFAAWNGAAGEPPTGPVSLHETPGANDFGVSPPRRSIEISAVHFS
jgi:hypothetical protein